MSFPPMMSIRAIFEKKGINTLLLINTYEDGHCIESKEIELDPEELRELENEIIRQRLKKQDYKNFEVSISNKSLVIKCKNPINMKPINPNEIRISQEEKP